VKLATLVPHPTSNSAAVKRLEVGVNLGARMLRISYRLEADFPVLRLPPQDVVARGDKLWQHTCFEAFLKTRSEPWYLEFNFAPSRRWAALRFSGYREGGEPTSEEPVTQITMVAEPALLRLDALIMLDRLPPLGRPLQLALSAVIEERSGTTSFWALKHPEGRPDFHHADGYAMELP
jgi:hypothetical protein